MTNELAAKDYDVIFNEKFKELFEYIQQSSKDCPKDELDSFNEGVLNATINYIVNLSLMTEEPVLAAKALCEVAKRTLRTVLDDDQEGSLKH